MALSLPPPSKTVNYHQHFVEETRGPGDTPACSVPWVGRRGAARNWARATGRRLVPFSFTSVIPHPAFMWFCEFSILDTYLSRCRSMFWPRAELLLQHPLKMSVCWTLSCQRTVQACFCPPNQKPTRSRDSLLVCICCIECGERKRSVLFTGNVLRRNCTNDQKKMADILAI